MNAAKAQAFDERAGEGLLACLRSATRRRDGANRAWRDAIHAASRAGLSQRRIAASAGVSHQRVAQLLNMDRPESPPPAGARR